MSSRREELQEVILEGTIAVYREKGIHFTMDDLARHLGMSKKTIYTVFREKDELLLTLVDYMFNSIKKSEQKILEDPSLSTIDKIHKILGVIPDGYKNIDFRELSILRDRFPKIYEQLQNRLETDWEGTIALLEQGMEEGVIRKFPIPILKMMLEASLEQFFQRDILKANNLTYREGLEEVVNILVNGITV
jgi:AcrR family transcriptional regulator